jgi:hypothetical protein
MAAAWLSDDVGWEEWEEDWSSIGVGVFDCLSQAQKQATILEVAQALLDPNVKPPRVTAVRAGTVDAIYRELQGLIEMEIDTGEETVVRSMVLGAMDEVGYWDPINSDLGPDEEPFLRPAPDCSDYAEWSPLVEDLLGEILEDRDFDMANDFLDLSPTQAAVLKENYNILPDYFSAVASDPTAEQLLRVRDQLKRLLW